MLGESRVEIGPDSLLEERTVEGFRPPPERLGLEATRVPLELPDGADEAIDRLALEEETRGRIGAAGRHHRLPRAPLPEGAPKGGQGPRLQALLALLTGAYRLSKRQAGQLLGDVCALPVSAAQVCALEGATVGR